jgi:hypothetical protein
MIFSVQQILKLVYDFFNDMDIKDYQKFLDYFDYRL